MVDIVCSDKEIEKLIKKLCDLVTKNNGFVHNELRISCANGDLKIEAPKEINDGAAIITLPKECLLPHSRFELGLNGDDLVIKSHEKDKLTKGQVEMMSVLLEIYNKTGKIKDIKASGTMSLLRTDPELLDRILQGRDKAKLPFLEKMKNYSVEEFFLNSFIKTRVLGFKESIESEEEQPQYERLQVLMPVIDFLNHHPLANGFMTRFSESSAVKRSIETLENEGVAVVKCCPFEGLDECYVNYGNYDAMDTFLHYNYVERNAIAVRSVPMEISLPGLCTLNIGSDIARIKANKLPDQIKDLAFYMPGIQVDKELSIVSLTSVFIPQPRAPRAMRRILGAALSQLGTSLSEQEMSEYVFEAEAHIISKNIQFFQGLIEYLEAYNFKPEIKIIYDNALDMAATQVDKIQNYPFYQPAMERYAGMPGKKIA